MTTIRLRGHLDLVATLPYQLGFYPHRSLVVVTLRDGRVRLVQRIDLPAGAPSPQLGALVGRMCAQAAEQRAGEAILVGYESVPGESTPLSALVEQRLRADGVSDVAQLAVVGEVMWRGTSRRAEDAEPLPPLHEVPAVAEWVALGRAPLARREDLEALVRGSGQIELPVPAAPRAGRASERSGSSGGRVRRTGRDEDPLPAPALALRAWAEYLLGPEDGPAGGHPPPAPDPGLLQRLAHSLRDVQVRDDLLMALRPHAHGSGPGQCGAAVATWLAAFRGEGSAPLVAPTPWTVVDALAAVCRSAPDSAAPAPLTVLAVYAWWLGDGALSRVAVEHALRLDPGYRLAALLEHLLDLGVRPPLDFAGPS